GFVLSFVRVGDPDPWTLANVHDYIAQPAAFLRAWALEQVGYLDPSLYWCLDWDLFIRLSRRWPTRRIPEALALARAHDAAKTLSGGFRRFREMRRMTRRHADDRFSPVMLFCAYDVCAITTTVRLRRALGRVGLDASLITGALTSAASQLV